MPAIPDAQAESLQSYADGWGYRFCDLRLFRVAVTVPTWVNEHPQSGWPANGRMEFLGDAVLDLVVAHALFLNYPELSEGELTVMRAGLVAQPALASTARQCGLGERLFVGAGDERDGARTRAATLADALEAWIAAAFLDASYSGQDPVRCTGELVSTLWGERLQDAKRLLKKDLRTQLQELVQGALRTTPRYSIQVEGRKVRCRIHVAHESQEIEVGCGVGATQRQARELAAADGLKRRAWEALRSAASGDNEAFVAGSSESSS